MWHITILIVPHFKYAEILKYVKPSTLAYVAPARGTFHKGVTFSASDHAGAQTTPNRTPAILLEDHLSAPKGAA